MRLSASQSLQNDWALAQVVLRGKRGLVIAVEPSSVGEEGHAFLNTNVLRDDHTILGPEKTGRMVDAFFDHAAKKVKQLARALANADMTSVAYIAHNLKGSAASLGLNALENRPSQLEIHAKLEDGAALARQFETFITLFEKSVSTLRAYWLQLDGPQTIQRSKTSAANM